MMNFSARYYKTVYDNAEYLDYNTYDPLSGDRYSYSGQPAGYYDITGLSYTLYFKYFGSRYVAPWGRYVMFGPVLNTVKTSYNPTVMYLKDDYNYNNVSNTIIKDFGDFEQKYNGFNVEHTPQAYLCTQCSILYIPNLYTLEHTKIDLANYVVIEYKKNLNPVLMNLTDASLDQFTDMC